MPDETVDPRLSALGLVSATEWRPESSQPSLEPLTARVASDTEPMAAVDLVIDLAGLALEEASPASPHRLDAVPIDLAPAAPTVELDPARAAEAMTEVPTTASSTAPVVAPKPEPALAESATLFQAEILLGWPPRRADLKVQELGLRITGAQDIAVPWSEVSEIRERRGRIVISGRRMTLRLSVGIDRVAEPTLAGPFARVLAEARAGTLDLDGTAFHDLANATDPLRDRFLETDDPVVAGVLGIVMALLTALFALVLPQALMIATQASVPSGAFLISTRLSPLDPRILVAALGAAGLLVSVAARVALGAHAGAWARGTLRGWQRSSAPAMGTLSRLLAVIVWFPGLAAAAVLLGVVSGAPSARVQSIVGASGVLIMRELPFFDSHHAWSSVTQIVEIPAPMEADRHVEGIAVVIHFASGSPLNTYDLKVRNGTDGQVYSLSRKWREAATAP